MAERLMGIETEYAVSTADDWGGGFDPNNLAQRILALARKELVHLPDVYSGLYLGNGARFYVDYGNHPELTTPECTNPRDVVRYILAGERILADLAAKLSRELGIEVMLFKSNVDYGGRWVTWGCHESYMHRDAPYALSEQIIPHLVTRIIYTGAGGFNSQSSGLEFTLSPRVAHLANVVSNNSTSDRGIFHTKDESLTRRGFHRLHLICGESLCSETAMWLKIATTALVVAMAEAGLHPGAGVGLRSPLQAMQAIAGDAECSALVETTQGRRLSAIEIQHHYLSKAEKHLGDSWMPRWGEEVCVAWRETLNRLLDAPESVTATLDWAMKRALYASYSNSRGVAWDSLPYWSRVFAEVRQAFDESEERAHPLTAEFIRNNWNQSRQPMARLTAFLENNGLSWDALDAVYKLRQELLEIDTRFGQLGGCGIFEGLDRAGVLEHHVRGVDAIEEAMTEAPALGRARLRGEVVQRIAGENGRYLCDWQGIFDTKTRRLLDLSEPFETVERWLEFEQVAAAEPSAFYGLVTRLDADTSPVF